MPELQPYHPLFGEDVLTSSQTAARMGIDNSIPDFLQPNARRLSQFLGQVNAAVLGSYQRPMHVSSGFRCDALNAAVGGAAQSDHKLALAADNEVAGVRPYDFAIFLSKILPAYDLDWHQMIIEFGQWVHLGLAPEGLKGARQLLTASRRPNGSTVYLPGLQDLK